MTADLIRSRVEPHGKDTYRISMLHILLEAVPYHHNFGGGNAQAAQDVKVKRFAFRQARVLETVNAREISVETCAA